jgi:hypothetical protein
MMDTRSGTGPAGSTITRLKDESEFDQGWPEAQAGIEAGQLDRMHAGLKPERLDAHGLGWEREHKLEFG